MKRAKNAEPQPFDITTKDPESTSTWTKHYKGNKLSKTTEKYDEDELIP